MNKRSRIPLRLQNVATELTQREREAIYREGELGALPSHQRYANLVGAGCPLHTESAIQIANAVALFRPMWLEEPVPSNNPEAMLTVRRATRVPIACGENVCTRYAFRPYFILN
jgi:hypothetical protein